MLFMMKYLIVLILIAGNLVIGQSIEAITKGSDLELVIIEGDGKKKVVVPKVKLVLKIPNDIIKKFSIQKGVCEVRTGSGRFRGFAEGRPSDQLPALR